MLLHTAWHLYCTWISATITNLTCAVTDLHPPSQTFLHTHCKFREFPRYFVHPTVCFVCRMRYYFRLEYSPINPNPGLLRFMADRFRLPPRRAGLRCFDSGLTIRTSTKLLLEGALVALMYVRTPGRCLPLGCLPVISCERTYTSQTCMCCEFICM